MTEDPEHDFGWFRTHPDSVHATDHPPVYGLLDAEVWLGGWQRNPSGAFDWIQINSGSLDGPFTSVTTTYDPPLAESPTALLDDVLLARALTLDKKPSPIVSSLLIAGNPTESQLLTFDDVAIYQAQVPEGVVTVNSTEWSGTFDLITIGDLSEALRRRAEYLERLT